MNKWTLALGLLSMLYMSCAKNNEDAIEQPVSGQAAYKFDSLVFNNDVAYFASDGSMTSPTHYTAAQMEASKIDITYLYNFSYSAPGFYDPVERSHEWYRDGYYQPWLSGSVRTRLYSTNLRKKAFDEAGDDESKIATYFSDTSTVAVTPNSIFPDGSCIGGLGGYAGTPYKLLMGTVWGFKNVTSGKRGLIFIRTEQVLGWPDHFINANICVDLIKEH